MKSRLRDLDVSVLDAEQALTAAGHGDLADALDAHRVVARTRVGVRGAAGREDARAAPRAGVGRRRRRVRDPGRRRRRAAAPPRRARARSAPHSRRSAPSSSAPSTTSRRPNVRSPRARNPSATPTTCAWHDVTSRRDARRSRASTPSSPAPQPASSRVPRAPRRSSPNTRSSRRRTGASARRCPSSVRPRRPHAKRCDAPPRRAAQLTTPFAAPTPTRRAGRRAPRRSQPRSTPAATTPPSPRSTTSWRHRPARRPPRHRCRRRGRGARGAGRRRARGRGRRPGRARARRSNASPTVTPGALLVVADAAGSRPPAPSVPGARLLADCVRSPVPGLAAAVERLLDGAVLADGDWSRALDLVLARAVAHGRHRTR